MKRIWAPWRKSYIRLSQKKTKQCLFCGLLKARQDKKNLIVAQTPFSFAILNAYPYNNGHVMIVPKRHVAQIELLRDEERLDWLNLYTRAQAALDKTLQPQGFNVGMNLGRVAGAGVPDHVHLHIVPRWNGDSNFMPVIGETKVISESLQSVYQVLAGELQPKKKYGKKR